MTPAEEEVYYRKQRHNDMKWLFGIEPDPEPEPEADPDPEVEIRPGLKEASDKAKPKREVWRWSIPMQIDVQFPKTKWR